MDLSNARLGEEYKVYVDDDFIITSIPSKTILDATVVGLHNGSRVSASVLLGWDRKSFIAPSAASKVPFCPMSGVYVPNLTAAYPLTIWVPASLTVAGCVKCFGKTTGHKCKECGDFNQWIERAPEDGAYVCALCINRARMFGA